MYSGLGHSKTQIFLKWIFVNVVVCNNKGGHNWRQGVQTINKSLNVIGFLATQSQDVLTMQSYLVVYVYMPILSMQNKVHIKSKIITKSDMIYV